MASTYPLEIVQAKRWLDQRQNASLRGEALTLALNNQPWDPSVKSLVPFRDVLTLLNEQLDWTQQLGDAMLAQQEDTLNAVQVLRGRAQSNGALRNGPQQTVTVTRNVVAAAPASSASAQTVPPPPEIIAIAPANPEQIYVPAYNPSVVYGSWPYPADPPTYYPPPAAWGVGSAILTGMAFAGGVAVVNSLWGWARPGWGGGNVDIDVNRVNTINANRSQLSGNRWQHDQTHRHGVAYRNQEVSDRYRGSAAARDRAQEREQFRGRIQQAERGGNLDNRRADRNAPPEGRSDRANLGERRRGDANRGLDRADQRPHGNRPGSGDRRPGGDDGRPNFAERGPSGGAAQRPSAVQRPAAQQRVNGRSEVQRLAETRQAPQGLQGLGQGGRERAAVQRGEASRQGQPAARVQAQQTASFQRGGGGRAAAANRSGGGYASRGGFRGR